MLDATDIAILDRLYSGAPDGLAPAKLRKRIIRQTREMMFRALTNVRPSHLADPELFDFVNLAADVELRPSGPENP